MVSIANKKTTKKDELNLKKLSVKFLALVMVTALTVGAALSLPFKSVRALEASDVPLRFMQVAVGGGHTLALTFDGDLYGWGNNSDGQLLVEATNVPTPTRIIPKGKVASGSSVGDRIVKIAASKNTSAILLNSGEVYFFGNNTYSQAGASSVNSKIGITRYNEQSGGNFAYLYYDIAAGENHFVLQGKGFPRVGATAGSHGLVGLGNNSNFQYYGTASNAPRNDFYNFALTDIDRGFGPVSDFISGGKVYAGGNNTAFYYNYNTLSGIIAVGQNKNGSLGINVQTENVMFDATGVDLSNTALTTSTNNVKIDNNNANISRALPANISTTFLASSHESAGSVIDATLLMKSDFNMQATYTPDINNDIRKNQSLVSNYAYELGGEFSLIKDSTGKVYGTGDSAYFLLNSGNHYLPVNIPALDAATDLAIYKGNSSAADDYIGAAVINNSLKVWKAGSADLIDITLLGASEIVSVTGGYSNSFVALDNLGRIYEVKTGETEVHPFHTFQGSVLSVIQTNQSVNIPAIQLSVQNPTASVSLYRAPENPQLVNSSRAFLTKMMMPVRDAAFQSGATVGDWTSILSTHYDSSLSVPDSLNEQATDSEFALQYFEGGEQVSAEYAARFFEVSYSWNQSAADLNGRINNNNNQTISFRTLRSTNPENTWHVKVWVGAYDQYGSGARDEYFYGFTQVTISLYPVANNALNASSQKVIDTDLAFTLDPNDPTANVANFSTVDLTLGFNEFKDYLADGNKATFTEDTERINFETLLAGKRFTPLAEDPDGDILRFADSAGFAAGRDTHTQSDSYMSVTRYRGFMDFELDFGTSGFTAKAIVAEYPNYEGLDISVVGNDVAGYKIRIAYEYLEFKALITFLNNDRMITIALSEHYNSQSTQNAAATPYPFTFTLNSIASITFANYDNGAGTSKSVVEIGNTSWDNNFKVGRKTRGATDASVSGIMYVGDTVVLEVSELFTDATMLDFVTTQGASGIDYIQHLNLVDNDLYKLTLAAKTLTIEVYDRFNISFDLLIVNRKRDEGNKKVRIRLQSTHLPGNSQIDAKQVSMTISAPHTFTSTDLFQAGYKNLDNPADNVGTNANIIIVDAVSATPSLATVILNRDSNSLTVVPSMDGSAEILVTARFFSYAREAQSFFIRVTNCTVFSTDIKFNGVFQLPLIDLKSELAYANTDNDINTFINNLELAEENAVSFQDEGSNEVLEESSVVEFVHAQSLDAFILNAKMVSSVDETVMFVKFIHKTSRMDYNIQINIRSTHRTLLEDGTIKTFVLGKEETVFNAQVFAVGMGFSPSDYSTIRIDFIKLGDITDEQVNKENRVSVNHTSRSPEFTLVPNRDGTQRIYFVVYAEGRTEDINQNGTAVRYLFEAVVTVEGITTTLTLERYGMAFLIAGAVSFFLLFIIFLIRFGVFMKKSAEQKKIKKRNEMLIKMRDKIHQNTTSANKQKIVSAKLKMQDPKYSKMVEDMRKEKVGDAPKVSLEPNTFAMDGSAKVVTTPAAEVGKGGKKKKKSADQMRKDLEAKKAQLAQMQGGSERSAIDEQIKARMSDDLLDLDI